MPAVSSSDPWGGTRKRIPQSIYLFALWTNEGGDFFHFSLNRTARCGTPIRRAPPVRPRCDAGRFFGRFRRQLRLLMHVSNDDAVPRRLLFKDVTGRTSRAFNS